MTDLANNSQNYWYIRVPKSRCPEPNFHFFDRIGLHSQDSDGNHYYDIGEIIGIKYTTKGNEPGEWYYLMRYLKCDSNPSLNGSEDEYFQLESRFVPDHSAIAIEE